MSKALSRAFAVLSRWILVSPVSSKVFNYLIRFSFPVIRKVAITASDTLVCFERWLVIDLPPI